MADEPLAPEPEIDVDALDDKAFEDLKTQMRSDKPAPDTQKPEPQADKADSEPDDTGDDEPSADANGKKQEVVPHAKFHQANERRKAAEARAEKAEAERLRALDRLQQLLERDNAPQATQTQQVAPEDAIPDPDLDPIAAVKWAREQILADRDRRKAEAETRETQTREQQQLQTAIDTAQRQFAERAQADPTVTEAYEALKSSYVAEMQALGYTPQMAQQELVRIEAQGINYALTNNINVADYVVNLAKARGWQHKPAAPANDAQNEAQKLAQREEARLASQSLGKGGGAVVNTGVISPEQLLDMSDEEFAAYKKKHGSVASAFRQAS